MRFRLVIIFAILFFSNSLIAQENNNIKQAIELGKAWKFEEAIKLLEQEIKINSKNAEAYYWLARYCHYIVYDTRPFTKKDDEWSKTKVLLNLKKAIELKPDFGDAHYFIAVEYGCRAREALKNKNIQKAKKELSEANKLGGFPPYALEYSKNILKACDKNAILFVDGDAAFNSIMYLQLVEGLRKDISLVVLSLLERPFYIKLIRDGIPNEIKKVPISWNDNLIMEMHNYLWKENYVKIFLTNSKKNEYQLKDTSNYFTLKVSPDYGADLLWSGTAVIISMFENNKGERPVYFSLFSGNSLFSFTDYLQNEGFVYKFMPYKVKETPAAYNTKKFEEEMFNAENYKDFGDIKFHNQPKAAYFFADNRRDIFLDYVQFLINCNKKDKAKTTLKTMDIVMPQSVYPLSSELDKKYKAIKEKL
jgi:tetratricopeptide (TPR) repeat protein